MKDLSFVDNVVLSFGIKVFLGYSLLPQQVIEEGKESCFCPWATAKVQGMAWG